MLINHGTARREAPLPLSRFMLWVRLGRGRRAAELMGHVAQTRDQLQKPLDDQTASGQTERLCEGGAQAGKERTCLPNAR